MARNKSSPPTKDDILERKRLAETYWGPLHNSMQIDYDIVQNTQSIGVPAGYEAYYTGTGFSIIDTAAQHITNDVPQINVPEANASMNAQDRSERLEDGLRDAQYRIDATTTDNIRRTIVKNGLWSGMLVSKGPIFLPDAWGKIPTEDGYDNAGDYKSALDQYEADKKITWPIYRAAVDPRWVFPDPGTTGKKWVIESYQREVGQIAAQFPEWDKRTAGMPKGSKPLPDTQLMDFTSFMDEHYRGFLVGSQLIGKVYEHQYGKPYYQIRSAGYGIDTGKPEERFRSIIYPARSLLNAKIAVLNQLIAITRRTAWPFGLTPMGHPITEITPGAWLEFPEDKISLPRQLDQFEQGIVQHLMNLIGMLDEQIESLTFPNVLKGANSGGARAGYLLNSQVAQAKVKFEPAIANQEAIEQEFYVDLANCVVNVIEEDLPVWGETRWGKVDSTIRVEDAKGLRHVQVRLNPKLPMDRGNEIAIGQVLKQLGVITDDIFLSDFAGYSEPGKILEAVRVERAMNSPEIQRIFNFAAFLETDYADYVFQKAEELGIDKLSLLQLLGFGGPTAQAPGNEAPGDPANIQAQMGAQRNPNSNLGGEGVMTPRDSLLGAMNKSQPGAGAVTGSLNTRVLRGQTTGTPSNIRNQVAPGLKIGA